jgi:hypothetical protein
MSRYIVDRKLPERTHLMFYFPKAQQDFFVVRLPFFENPKISESKKAKYQTYSVIGRSSNLYTYTGADSRRFDLEFSMTLPHIIEQHPELNRDKYIGEAKFDSGEITKDAFFQMGSKSPIEQSKLYVSKFFNTSDIQDSAKQVLGTEAVKKGMSDVEKIYFLNTYKLSQAQLDIDQTIEINATGGELEGQTRKVVEQLENREIGTDAVLLSLTEAEERRLQLIDLIIYWLNIVRSSVINNATNPLLGPPVVRLSHGVMYQDVPCICTDYKIDFDEKAGYDFQTLLPRRVTIKMTLEEFRTGDFGKFDQNNIIARDNLVGWEAIFEEGSTESLDPGYI